MEQKKEENIDLTKDTKDDDNKEEKLDVNGADSIENSSQFVRAEGVSPPTDVERAVVSKMPNICGCPRPQSGYPKPWCCQECNERVLALIFDELQADFDFGMESHELFELITHIMQLNGEVMETRRQMARSVEIALNALPEGCPVSRMFVNGLSAIAKKHTDQRFYTLFDRMKENIADHFNSSACQDEDHCDSVEILAEEHEKEGHRFDPNNTCRHCIAVRSMKMGRKPYIKKRNQWLRKLWFVKAKRMKKC